jgi:hypothetical protein
MVPSDSLESDKSISEGVGGNNEFSELTLVGAVEADVLASEASGIETIANPSFPNFSLDVFQELFSNELLDFSDNT